MEGKGRLLGWKRWKKVHGDDRYFSKPETIDKSWGFYAAVD